MFITVIILVLCNNFLSKSYYIKSCVKFSSNKLWSHNYVDLNLIPHIVNIQIGLLVSLFLCME